VLSHDIKDVVVGAPGIDEHATTMAGNDGGVSCGGGASGEHALEYRAAFREESSVHQ
jgi:hypothetical protein